MFNVFNLTDTQTATGVYQITAPYFGQPSARVPATVVRFSSRFTF
jgi:hypothetical protein